MNLKKLVIHQINKETGTKEFDVNFSKSLLDCSEQKRINLVTELAKSFSKSRTVSRYSGFDRSKRFPVILDNYLNNLPSNLDPSEDDFLEFTKLATNLLGEFMEEAPASKGGYLVFAEYIAQQTICISVFLVRDTQGNVFHLTDDGLDVDNITVTDTEKLAMACRINVSEFLRNLNTALMTINVKSSEGVSDYFDYWLGSSETESTESYTEKFMDVIRNIPPPNDPHNPGKQISTEKVFERVYEEINKSTEKMANIDTIGLVAFGDEDVIRNYISKHNIPLPSEFKTYQKSLKKMIEINVNISTMHLKFSRNDVQRGIIMLDEEAEAVIIKFPKMYQALQEQLSRKQIDEQT